jgi:hypothetical protein
MSGAVGHSIWRFAAVAASILVSGCAATDQFQDRVSRYGRAAEQARDEMILTNIIRASRSEPLSFVSVSGIHGSATTTGAVGLPAIVIGPAQTAAQHQYVFGGGSGSGSPNAVSSSGSTTIDVSVQETKDFYRGLLTPVSPRTVAFFTAQGIPREILFYLFTDRLIETKHGTRREIRNDPLSPTFEDFKQYVELAMEFGLSSETITSPAGGRSKESKEPKEPREPKEESRLCFDPLFKASKASLTGLNPICGSNKHLNIGRNVSTFISRTGEPVSLEIKPRSTFEIFNYLGRLVTAGDAGLIKLSNLDDGRNAETEDNILFVVVPGMTPCFVSVTYGSSSYCVPDGNAPNTTKILGLLAQLLALNTTINDLPATPSVRIVP